MKAFQLKRTRSRVSPQKYYPFYAALCVAGALCVALIVVCVVQSHTAHTLSLARDQLLTRMETDLSQAMRSFDKMTLPSADIQGDILPTMRTHLYAASALNEVLVEVYGEGESLLDREEYRQIVDALDEVEKRASFGQSTETARQTLGTYMTAMQSELTDRFGAGGTLLPRTALK